MNKKINIKNKEDNKKQNNFLQKNIKESFNYLKETKNYFTFSILFFALLVIIGFIFPIFFKDSILKLLEELIKQTQGLNAFELIIYIIKNNIQSAFIAMILGLGFGLAPIIIVAMNGYVLGFVANKSVAIEGPLILWRLIPHGIFEIPAVMVSAALGIKLGLFLFTCKKKAKKKEFLRQLINSFRVFFFIVIPFLIIAGIIEGILMQIIG